MPDSGVETIIAAVATVLATTPGIKGVYRDGVDALSIEQYPAVIISVQDDTPEHLLNDYLERTLTVGVTCWVRAQKDVSKALEAFKAEVRKKMAADRALGVPNKLDSYEGPSSGPFPMNLDLCEAAEVIEYTIRYRTTRTDPFTLIG